MPICGSIWLIGKRRRQLCWLRLGLSCGGAANGGPVTKWSFFENMGSTKEPTRTQGAAPGGRELLDRVTACCSFDAGPGPVRQRSLCSVAGACCSCNLTVFLVVFQVP